MMYVDYLRHIKYTVPTHEYILSVFFTYLLILYGVPECLFLRCLNCLLYP